jgi:hypothetical protein
VVVVVVVDVVVVGDGGCGGVVGVGVVVVAVLMTTTTNITYLLYLPTYLLTYNMHANINQTRQCHKLGPSPVVSPSLVAYLPTTCMQTSIKQGNATSNLS